MSDRTHRRRLPIALTALAFALACGGDEPPAEDSAGPAEDAAPAVVAEGPDIWLADIAWADGRPALSNLRNATDRPGYDNQPQFFADGSVYYTSQEGERTDIWRIDPATGTTSPVTRTDPESEYSATPTPDGTGFTAIRVEADSTQRLWRFDLEGNAIGPVFESVAPVGYHAWIDDARIGMFILGSPASLQVGTAGTDGAELVVEGIGRSLNRIPGRTAISFPVAHSPDSIEIHMYDGSTTSLIVQGLAGSQDHAWGNGVIFQAQGSILYTFDPERPDEGWVQALDLTDAGVQITRLAVRGDAGMIAIVGEVTAAEED